MMQKYEVFLKRVLVAMAVAIALGVGQGASFAYPNAGAKLGPNDAQSPAASFTFEQMLKCDAAFTIFVALKKNRSMISDRANIPLIDEVPYNSALESGNGGAQIRNLILINLYAKEHGQTTQEVRGMVIYLQSRRENDAFTTYLGDVRTMISDYNACKSAGADTLGLH